MSKTKVFQLITPDYIHDIVDDSTVLDEILGIKEQPKTQRNLQYELHILRQNMTEDDVEETEQVEDYAKNVSGDRAIIKSKIGRGQGVSLDEVSLTQYILKEKASGKLAEEKLRVGEVLKTYDKISKIEIKKEASEEEYEEEKKTDLTHSEGHLINKKQS